jgi:hypothetical protein
MYPQRLKREIWVRAKNGPGRAGPGLTIPIFLTGRAELPKSRPGPARPVPARLGSFAVGRILCRDLCLVLPFLSRTFSSFLRTFFRTATVTDLT